MLKRIPIRVRLTLLCVLLLTVCCVGLTVILNFSANKMADVIEATPVTPAFSVEEAAAGNTNNGTVMMAPPTPSEGSQVARKSFLYESILYMLVMVVVGAGLTYYLSGKALKPLQELSNQMKNRTVHNLLEDLEIPQTKDEIADLTYSFNEMSHKLDEAFSMQKRFSQSAAHELRTPLAVLKTKVEVFKKKKSHTLEEYDLLLDVVATHTNRLSDLVKDLLDLTNMDALEYNQTVTLKELLSDIEEELSMLAKEKNISLALNGTEHSVQGNESLLYRAFYNLVENAIKYNHENGSVDITLALEDEHTVIAIEDTGTGIPQDMREMIFEPFFRVDKSRSRKMGGAGLGLSTVKSIIDKHHGEISVSENVKGGSIFRIVL